MTESSYRALYQDHFGIRENPFSIVPDPHFLFMSQRHQEALAHLLYGVGGNGGFVLLTGEVGTGKTTICRALIEQLPENTDLALILNPKLTQAELLAVICDEMRIAYPPGTKSLKDFFDSLTRHLLDAHARGRNPVLMIDEAQNLSPDVLELVRLLTNLETSHKKLLQIILVGQPELNAILARPDMRQTLQRITARYHLQALEANETRAYIAHRLSVAGLDERIFTTAALKVVFKTTHGIPRVINSICDRALLAAYVEARPRINARLARKAAAEVLGTASPGVRRAVWLSVALVLSITATIWLGFGPGRDNAEKNLRFFFPTLRVVPPVAVPPPKKTVTKPLKTAAPITPAKPPPKAKPPRAMTNTPERAFITLYKMWDQPYLTLRGLGPCDKAQAAKLSCLQGKTTLKGLQAINRPAVVSLTGADGEQAYGVVTAITGPRNQEQRIAVRLAKRTLDLDAATFLSRWGGDYLVLWRAPEIFHRPLTTGLKGPDVAQLRHLLRLAGYGDAATDKSLFDPGLRAKVRAFQDDHGLNVDGIAGRETIARIIGVAGTTAIATISRTGNK